MPSADPGQRLGFSRRRRWIALLLVLAACVYLGVALTRSSGLGTPAGPPSTRTGTTPPPPTAERFGANVNLLFNDRLAPPAEIDAQLAALKATGATVARSDAFWEAAEPTPPSHGVHHYDWRFDDTIAAALAAHGLVWLPIIDYTAPWTQSVPGQDHSPPASAADYAAYAGAVAARYGHGGAFWAAHPELTARPVDAIEIWNEPDNPVFWAPAPDPARYARLYAQARAAIAASQPQARVVIGGLSRPARFLPALLAADPGLRGAIDGVAIHPYGPSPAAVLARVRLARGDMRSLGLGSVPLYVTEFGWATRPPGALDWAPAARRPALIAQTLGALGASGCGVAAALLYTWVSPERNPTDHEQWFGISPPAGGSRPDVAAFASGVVRAAAASRSAATRRC